MVGKEYDWGADVGKEIIPPYVVPKKKSRYANDKIYADYSYDDETSSFDPQGEWQGGSEYYRRTYRARVPRRLLEKALQKDDLTPVHDWLECHSGIEGIWR